MSSPSLFRAEVKLSLAWRHDITNELSSGTPCVLRRLLVLPLHFIYSQCYQQVHEQILNCDQGCFASLKLELLRGAQLDSNPSTTPRDYHVAIT